MKFNVLYEITEEWLLQVSLWKLIFDCVSSYAPPQLHFMIMFCTISPWARISECKCDSHPFWLSCVCPAQIISFPFSQLSYWNNQLCSDSRIKSSHLTLSQFQKGCFMQQWGTVTLCSVAGETGGSWPMRSVSLLTSSGPLGMWWRQLRWQCRMGAEKQEGPELKLLIQRLQRSETEAMAVLSVQSAVWGVQLKRAQCAV